MSDYIITGQVFLSQCVSADEAVALAAHLTECAVKNKIWVNACGHFKNPDAAYKCSPGNYLLKGYIPFEITDSEHAFGADRILSEIWYRDEDGRIADLSSSGFVDIQSFLEELIKQDWISNISVSLDLAHGYQASNYSNCMIHANAFCSTLMALPAWGGVPTGEFNIVKDEVPTAARLVNPAKAARLRAAFIKKFVDTSTECYQAIEKEKPTDIVYEYTHRYLRDTLYRKKCTVIPFRRAIQVISGKKRVYSMWDIRPRDILPTSDQSWLAPPPKPRYLNLYGSDTVIEWDPAEFAALLEQELGDYDSTNCLEISIPEDLYVFDDSAAWCVIFTHDAIDGERFCLLGGSEGL